MLCPIRPRRTSCAVVKTPDWPHVVGVVLVVGVLVTGPTAVADVLVPRVVRIVLRRRPVVVERRQPANTAHIGEFWQYPGSWVLHDSTAGALSRSSPTQSPYRFSTRSLHSPASHNRRDSGFQARITPACDLPADLIAELGQLRLFLQRKNLHIGGQPDFEFQ